MRLPLPSTNFLRGSASTHTLRTVQSVSIGAQSGSRVAPGRYPPIGAAAKADAQISATTAAVDNKFLLNR